MDEVTRVKNFIENGPVGRFNLEKEVEFINNHRQTTEQMYSNGYISQEQFCVETMMLSARYLKLVCFRQEMFERYPGCLNGN